MTQPDEELDLEAPEADVSEQATPAEPDDADGHDDRVRTGAEVPEADAVEQSRAVVGDDDYR
ncbi:hypothetical protein AB0J74_32275 [Asanoa sp. NPDC049573]|uniref:hypothetical protein n=1 Tax=Asanoa sp. NPDC049573 TaxID=3155396 RepID=UPI00343A53B0